MANPLPYIANTLYDTTHKNNGITATKRLVELNIFTNNTVLNTERIFSTII